MRFFQGRNDISSRPRFVRLVNRIWPFSHVHVPPTSGKKAGKIKEKKKKIIIKKKERIGMEWKTEEMDVMKRIENRKGKGEEKK